MSNEQKSEYSLSINELIERDIIRDDQPYEWANKMTDEEIKQYENEVYSILKEEGVPQKFPDIQSAYLSKTIDRDILYNTFKQEKQ